MNRTDFFTGETMTERATSLPRIASATFFLLMAIVLMSGTLFPAAAEKKTGVWLGAKRVESRLIEMAVPDFETLGGADISLGAQASRIITFDLGFTGYFKMNQNFSFMRRAMMADKRRGRRNFMEWRTMASNFLVTGSVNLTGKNSLTIDATVLDLQTKRKFLSKKISGSTTEFRRMIHSLSDDFLLRLTGEQGIANSRVAFISRIKRFKELFVADYDGFTPRPITDDRRLVLFPHWSPVDNKILFTTYRYRNPDLYALDLNNNSRYPISRRIGLNSTGEWSADGKKITFSLSHKGNSEIYTCNADGSDLVRLTNSLAIETSPTWSPDGEFIAFTSDRPGVPQIYVMRSDGSNKRRLTYTGRYNDGASWSPRGDFIAYSSLLDKHFDIALIEAHNIENPRKRETRRLTYGPGSNESPSFAPNGRHIAYSSKQRGKKQIAIVNVSGLNQSIITHIPGGGYLPSWGPVVKPAWK